MSEEIAYLREQITRCRRLAASTADERVARTLNLMADEYQARIDSLTAPAEIPNPRPVD